MGFFNFLYKLTNIFSNKRKLKVFIILCLILILVFCWSRGSFAATTEDVNALTNYQLALQEAVFGRLIDMVNNNVISPDDASVHNFVSNITQNFVFIETSTNDNAQFLIRCYRINRVDNGVVYNSPQDFTIEGSWEIGINSQGEGATQYPCKLAQFRGPSYVFSYGSVPFSAPSFLTFYLPDACFGLRSHMVNEFITTCNMVSGLAPTYSTSDEELQAIASSGFSSVNSNIQNQTNQMTNSINNASTSISNSVDSLNNTITDTTTDDNQIQFAQDNNTDLTSGFFSDLFNSFQNAFTSNNIVGVEFKIPFTNKSFTFSNRYVRTLVEQNEQFQPILVIVTAFWWFALGYYVILDIYKKINAIKSGDLTNIENENITTDLM